MLVLAHCLHPGLQFTGLCNTTISKKYVHDILVSFTETYCNYLLIENGEEEREKNMKKLRMDFIEWVQKNEVTDNYGNGIDAWNASLHFEPSSILYRVAIHLLSLPAHAADLERIFSRAKLILTSRRTNLGREKVLKSLQLKIGIKCEQKREKKEIEAIKLKKLEPLRVFRQDYTQESTNIMQNSEVQDVTPQHATEEEESHNDDADGEQNAGSMIENMIAFVTAELENEYLASLAAEMFETETDTEPEMTDADIANMLSNLDENNALPEPVPKKRRRLPGYRKVTRHFQDIFDLEVYKKIAAELERPCVQLCKGLVEPAVALRSGSG
eukprot:IDg3004t1